MTHLHSHPHTRLHPVIRATLMKFNVDPVTVMNYGAVLTDVALAVMPKLCPHDRSIIQNITEAQVMRFRRPSFELVNELSYLLKQRPLALEIALNAHQAAASRNVPPPPIPPNSPLADISHILLHYLIGAVRDDIGVLEH